MLLKDFYQIIATDTSGPDYRATLTLNPDHPLYGGHFPGMPILPGVCSLQLIKEVAEKMLDKPLQYAEVIRCKFLAALDPRHGNRLRVTFCVEKKGPNGLELRATVDTGPHVVVKLKALLTVVPV